MKQKTIKFRHCIGIKNYPIGTTTYQYRLKKMQLGSANASTTPSLQDLWVSHPSVGHMSVNSAASMPTLTLVTVQCFFKTAPTQITRLVTHSACSSSHCLIIAKHVVPKSGVVHATLRKKNTGTIVSLPRAKEAANDDPLPGMLHTRRKHQTQHQLCAGK